MNNREAVYIIQHINQFRSKMDELNEALDLVTDILDKDEDDGCVGCKYFRDYSFTTPCHKCKRNCRDFWEKNNEE